MLLLHHVGRRSGQERVSPLIYLRDGDDLLIVASYGGSHKHPVWWLNLREMSETTVQVGGQRQRVTVRQTSTEEKAGSGLGWSRSIRPTRTTRRARAATSR